MRATMHTVRRFAMATVVAAMPAWIFSDADTAGHPLTYVDQGGALARGYGLDVAAVPEVPTALAGSGEQASGPVVLDCPVEVRAVVGAAGDRPFAVVAFEDQSAVVRRGDKWSGDGRKWRVGDIEQGAVQLKLGTQAVRCELPKR